MNAALPSCVFPRFTQIPEAGCSCFPASGVFVSPWGVSPMIFRQRKRRTLVDPSWFRDNVGCPAMQRVNTEPKIVVGLLEMLGQLE